MNPVEIEEAVSQLALEPFDRGEFPFSFLRAFGNPETTIKRLRTGSTNQSDVGGVLQRSNIHIATCDAGEVEATLGLLRDSPKTATVKAKFILATDGDSFQAEDRTSGETVACDYADFPDHFGFFLPLAGITTVEQIRESSFDIRATGRLNKLYVELLKDNPDWAKAERRPDMNHFMARLIFCFFAEDTDIFVGEGLFTKTVEQMSARDSSDTHAVISEIFRAMDTKIADRQSAGIARYANQFPYVNGQLFSGSTEVPRFTKIARSYLNHIGNLNWKKINPDIFGSMIQAVADDEERGALGMHYTSVPNILKVLNPLFLDDLRGKLEEAGNNSRKLLNLRNRMARIRVFDPACGSGNFLVIAYKQMREIEAEINRQRGEPDRRSDIPLTNFRGIELRDFPAEIARLALIIAEFQCDVLYRGQQEALAEFLPLDSANWITCGNALRLDWPSIFPPTGTGVRVRSDDLFETPLDQSEIDFENAGGETYICGNPPYIGSRTQSKEHKDDLGPVLEPLIRSWKSLDYVAGWVIKAADYIRKTEAAFAFVATNSLNQGLQVGLLWPVVLKDDLEIIFAHQSFRWGNLAANAAGVTVAIVGVAAKGTRPTRLIFEGTVVKEADAISPYLTASNVSAVSPSEVNISGLPEMLFGNMPRDGGHLSLNFEEKSDFLRVYPEAKAYVARYLGAEELINGTLRYCLWIEDSEADAASKILGIQSRLDQVAKMRAASSAASTQKYARTPHRFVQSPGKGEASSILVAAHSSENRQYLPVDYADDKAVASNALFMVLDPPIWILSILLSKLHLAWITTICGKIKTDLRYSSTLGWNTFPLLKLTEQNKADLTRCAKHILLAREAHFPATIADLYDPKAMPADLRHAHEENDEVLERIYIGRRFRNDTERLEKLFDLYTKMATKGKAA
ncbi:class I SAM-dependent DNA methyltransferase [Sphingobium cupriresistens]|uniref:site-specific DNA-methyltransferase (adenine-specific) n=1 Tax=Sphingobium cupriresistens LL01 TaxID=1420583 RepID=A0A0J7XSF1_9SPHN|nr:DNA methyltransferase [Sphingobium cupriresistens]KMS54569.1 lactate dehydrogenase [Sphingobium cupriresistens LL01]